MRYSTCLLSATLASVCLANSAGAAVLASTTFDGRTASGPTASNLNWTLNGLQDPGSITNVGANLFDATALVQNNYTPGLNTGNINSSWLATVNITIDPGYIVTLEDVTFNSVSVNGSQAENVNRRNDYTVSLFNPSDILIDEVTIGDTLAGTVAGQPLVSFDLADTALNLPGTYTLKIRGGDFVDPDETGNHTGIDNLSINGTATLVPEPGSLALLALGGLIIARRRRA